MSAGGIERAQAALVRALRGMAGPFALWSVKSTRWASATFDGARHRLVLALEGEDAGARADRLQAMLGEAEIAFPGGFVADIGVETRLEGGAIVLAVEALTIVEAAAASVSPAARQAG